MTNDLHILLEIEQADTPTDIAGTVVYLLSLPIILTLSYIGVTLLLSFFGIFVREAPIVIWLGGLSSFIAAGISGIYGIINWSALTTWQRAIVIVQAVLFIAVLAFVVFLAFILLTGKPLFSKM